MQDIVLISIPETTIRNIVEQAVNKAFSDHSLRQDHLGTQVVDLSGLLIARPFLGTRSTVYKKVSRGLIPHSKSGKKLIFDLNIIDDWLLSNQITTPAEIEAEAEHYMNGRNKKRSRKAPLK